MVAPLPTEQLYFAYGSNMSWQQMQRRCPDAAFIWRATLEDHTLAFTRDSPSRGCGVAVAVYRRFARLPGVLYSVSATDIATLDRLEGYMPGVDAYRRVHKSVVLHEPPPTWPARVMAQTYVVANPVPHVPPSRSYRALIVQGAELRGLPAEHIAAIKNIVCAEDLR